MLGTVDSKSGAAASVRILDRRAVVRPPHRDSSLFVISVLRQKLSGSVK